MSVLSSLLVICPSVLRLFSDRRRSLQNRWNLVRVIPPVLQAIADVIIRSSGNYEFHSLVIKQQTNTHAKEVSVREPKLGIDLYSYPRVFELKTN